MKKIFFIVGILFFAGCAKKPLLDKCIIDKKQCEAKCKIDYINSDFKLKACNAKCEAVYLGCKAKEKVKEGYEKTKEYFKN